MDYKQIKSIGRTIIHKFSKGGSHYINRKHWDIVDMNFMENHTNDKLRQFMFTIRYCNPFDSEWKLNQFSMNEEEIKQFLEVVNKIVDEPSKFNYQIGDSFIIPSFTVEKVNCGDYMGKTIYGNVKGTIVNIYEHEKESWYILSFDGEQMIVKRDYLDKLRRC